MYAASRRKRNMTYRRLDNYASEDRRPTLEFFKAKKLRTFTDESDKLSQAKTYSKIYSKTMKKV